MKKRGDILSLIPACWAVLCVALLITAAFGCSKKHDLSGTRPGATKPPARSESSAALPASPLAVALATHEGAGKLDQEIRRFQGQVKSGEQAEQALERLGWLFVRKARESFDPGYYKLAEQCALALDARHPGSMESLLLRGHVLHNLHRFKEAEPLARRLVAERGLPFDFGLLGDVLMEQGRLDPAAQAYQTMVEMRPDLHSYVRGAHLRWLKGNVKGAERLMRMAASASSPLDAETAAWVHTRLAGYQFQLGLNEQAEQACAAALDLQRDYPPALLLRGRMLLAEGKTADAIKDLRRAAELNPLPEYQWTLSEALRAEGKGDEAAAVEKLLEQRGAAADPRTYSLYLSTRALSAQTAVKLARAELETRADVFTHDALAWALAAAGHAAEARDEMTLALAEGTRDARLLFHAAIISHRNGDESASQQWAAQASQLNHLLLPTEKEQLGSLALSSTSAPSASPIFPLAEARTLPEGNSAKKGITTQ